MTKCLSHTSPLSLVYIGMIVVDSHGDMACSTSTNGLGHKIAGRVGDSPLAGAGCYVDNDVGGAACTGDGDTMLRFSPSAMAVEYMRHGATPQEACEQSIKKIASKYPVSYFLISYIPFLGGPIIMAYNTYIHGIHTYRISQEG